MLDAGLPRGWGLLSIQLPLKESLVQWSFVQSGSTASTLPSEPVPEEFI